MILWSAFLGERSGTGLADVDRGKRFTVAGSHQGQAVGLAAGDCGGFVEVDAGSAAGVPAVHQRGAAPEFQRALICLLGSETLAVQTAVVPWKLRLTAGTAMRASTAPAAMVRTSRTAASRGRIRFRTGFTPFRWVSTGKTTAGW